MDEIPWNKCIARVWTIEDSFVNNDEHISLGATRQSKLDIVLLKVLANNNAIFKRGNSVSNHIIQTIRNCDPELLRRIGDATALEVRATGIPYVFAPCIAVCRDPRWGRCYESYSEDPKIVREMTDIILGLQGENPNSSLKGVPYVAGRYGVY
ncbi:hypothetical protein TEA_002220 [Camellia sinensis var. sinensis]|uniref:Glycoside hydrolase family 3 N-terminal domain-containing protein n=1 Tax=Camellia sinensis var. sinensis TaxID=542762 RepID=A0A4S4E6U4_CAMSN|nr:hypothetical protein TEA_002220 [Camellia sinensis var. sinensis]